MKPSQTVQALRHIASKLDGSTNPDRSLVAADVRRVLARIATNYLYVSSASGDTLWELPDGTDMNQLQSFSDRYNTTEEWTKRGGDGTVTAIEGDDALIEFASERRGEPVTSLEEAKDQAEGYGPIDPQMLEGVVSGKLDPLSGIEWDPDLFPTQ